MSSNGLSWPAYTADTLVGSYHADTASEGGLSQGFSGAPRHVRAARRKRRNSSSLAFVPHKKRRSARSRIAVRNPDDSSKDEDSIDELEGEDTELLYIRIDEAAGYYIEAFRSINQLAIKDILKAWIRVCHPKKQSKYPYNGGKDGKREESKAEYDYDGHYSRPDYWPCDENWNGKKGGVRHREPDHLYKNGLSVYPPAPMLVLISLLERLKLLPHLLQCEDKGYEHGDFTLEKLVKSTDGIQKDPDLAKNWKPQYFERLNEIYRVRAKERQYQRGEIGDCHSSWSHFLRCTNTMSDGETLVTVQMFKARRNIRKAPKSAAKTLKPSGKHARKEPEQSNTTVRKVPEANMRNSLQAEGRRLHLTEGSKPSNHTGTSPSTEEVTPEESCNDSTTCNDEPQHSVPENWTQRPTFFRQDSASFMVSNPSGSVVAPDSHQRFLPPRNHGHFGSSSMQSVRSQIASHHNDQAAWVQGPVQMRPNQPLTRSPPARPVSPKLENTRYPAFSGSSSGMAGWQPEEYLNPQTNSSSMFTASADPTASLLSCANGSFSSGYSDAAFSSGPQLEPWNDEIQNLIPPYCQGCDDGQQQGFSAHTVGIPRYDHLGMDTPPVSKPDLEMRFPTHQFCTQNGNPSSGTQHTFSPFSHDQRQL